MSIAQELRDATNNDDGANLSSVAYHVATAFNCINESFWADPEVSRVHAYTFLLLVAEALS